ncbi:MAG: hypothetical protein A2X11_02625 [Bacteroidetes bacterium GWE2_42_24]|nr:MAG: hypothetical protein A2X11_02625 [Bacteroidetes bacterium GWE2_42_24]OFY32324.1 MAG: hypothetical protein A2X09_11830 [Bacteroidetes bacterium GWF2_43_11]
MVIRQKNGKGATAKPGDKIRVNMVLSLLNGKKVFSSYDQNKPLLFEYGRRIENKGVEEALGLLQEGGQLIAIIPSDLAFGEEGRGEYIPPYSPVIYRIEMLEIITPEEYALQAAEKIRVARANETLDREKYLKQNNIKEKPLPSGLYVIEEKAGKGNIPKTGDKVKVHYTGYLTNGTRFDSSIDRGQPFEFEVGAGRVIKGWDEGIRHMKPGGKAKLIIPAELGYGERGSGDKIGPYATLVFEIELLSISNVTDE